MYFYEILPIFLPVYVHTCSPILVNLCYYLAKNGIIFSRSRLFIIFSFQVWSFSKSDRPTQIALIALLTLTAVRDCPGSMRCDILAFIVRSRSISL